MQITGAWPARFVSLTRLLTQGSAAIFFGAISLAAEASEVAKTDVPAQTSDEPKLVMAARFPADVDLPPQIQRRVIGTWIDVDHMCTESVERVKDRWFMVLRCTDGSGGGWGRELVKVGPKLTPKAGSLHGDYYVLEADGRLGSYDEQGYITTLSKHAGLRPRPWKLWKP